MRVRFCSCSVCDVTRPGGRDSWHGGSWALVAPPLERKRVAACRHMADDLSLVMTSWPLGILATVRQETCRLHSALTASPRARAPRRILFAKPLKQARLASSPRSTADPHSSRRSHRTWFYSVDMFTSIYCPATVPACIPHTAQSPAPLALTRLLLFALLAPLVLLLARLVGPRWGLLPTALPFFFV